MPSVFVLWWPTAPGSGRALFSSSCIRLAFIANQEQSKMSGSAVTEQDVCAALWLTRQSAMCLDQTNSSLLNGAEAEIYRREEGEGGGGSLSTEPRD